MTETERLQIPGLFFFITQHEYMTTAAEATLKMGQKPAEVISTLTDGCFLLENFPGTQVWRSLQVFILQLVGDHIYYSKSHVRQA